MKKTGKIILGVILIIIGIILGGNALGITNIDIFFDGWWTLFIIIPSFVGLFNDDDKTGNIIGILIGVVLLLACQDIINFSLVWKLIVPAILVIIGLSIIFKDTIGGKITKEIEEINKKQPKENVYTATFSGQDARCDGEFKGANLTAVFGGIEYDLRNAIINQDAVINTSSIFGGIDIYIPEDVTVKVKSLSIFGGVSDKKKRNEQNDSHTIYINATCLFGGVEIK